MANHIATWRNVQGFNTNAGNSAIANAGELFNKALSSATSQAKDNKAESVTQNTNTVLAGLLKENDSVGVDTFASDNSPLALNQRFGEGFFDQGKINAAIAVKREDVINADQKASLFSTNLAASNQRINTGIALEQSRKDAETLAAAGRAKDANAENAFANLVTPFQQQQINDAAFQSTEDSINSDLLRRFPQSTPISVFDDQGRLDLSGLDEATKADFFNVLSTTQAAEVPNFNVGVQNARSSLAASGVKGDRLDRAIGKFTKLLNSPKFSESEKAKQSESLNSIQSSGATSLERSNSVYADLLSRIKPNAVKSGEEIFAENTDLLTRMSERFDDPIYASYLRGKLGDGALGGGELLQEVNNLLTEGIVVDNTTVPVSAPILEQFLVGSSEGTKNDFFFDPYVNPETLKSNLRKFLRKNPKGRDVAAIQAIKDASNKSGDVIRANTANAIKTLNAQWNTASEVAVPGRNARVFAEQRAFQDSLSQFGRN